MFGIGGFELFIILIFGFLIFGPDKLPEVARLVGKGIARFRSAQQEMNEVIKPTDIFDPNDTEQPFKDPVEALDKLAKHQEEKRSGKAAEGNGAAGHEASAPKSEGAVTKDVNSTPKQESFTERKARYERERAARKAAEEKQAALAEGKGDAGGATGAESEPAVDSAKSEDTGSKGEEASAAATEGGDE